MPSDFRGLYICLLHMCYLTDFKLWLGDKAYSSLHHWLIAGWNSKDKIFQIEYLELNYLIKVQLSQSFDIQKAEAPKVMTFNLNVTQKIEETSCLFL